MYTQIRGWLNIRSSGDRCDYDEDVKLFDKAKLDYSEEERVCKDTHIHDGWNGTTYIFIGTELKGSYQADGWIRHLLTYFPHAEGRIDFQYEGKDKGDHTPYWLIYKGEVIKEAECEAWTDGCYNDL